MFRYRSTLKNTACHSWVLSSLPFFFLSFFSSAHLLFSPLFMVVLQHGSKADIPSSLNSNLKFCHKQTPGLPVSLYSVTFSFPVWKMSANRIGIHLIAFIYLDEGRRNGLPLATLISATRAARSHILQILLSSDLSPPHISFVIFGRKMGHVPQSAEKGLPFSLGKSGLFSKISLSSFCLKIRSASASLLKMLCFFFYYYYLKKHV